MHELYLAIREKNLLETTSPSQKGENMKGVIREIMQVPLHRWLMVILYGIIVFVIIYNLIDAFAQFLVHTLGYGLSESYRTHVQTFGGYWGYVGTQLKPRVFHSFFNGWQKSMAISSILSFLFFLIIFLTKNSKTIRFFALSVITVLFLGLNYARSIVRDPFWSAIHIFIWILCFFTAIKIYNILASDVEDMQ